MSHRPRGSMPAIALALALALPAPAAAGAPVADTLTVVTLNLWHDQHDWPRRRALILAELRARRPDVVCLQEVLQHATLPNQATALAESLGMRAHFTSVDPEGAPRRYGNAILTPHRVLATGGHVLAPLDDYRTVAHARVEVRGRVLDVYDTHLHHTAEGGAIRATQLADLLAYVDSTRGDGPLVLAGDFNAELDRPEMRPLVERFADAYACTHRAERVSGSFTLNPVYGYAPHCIDHVFVERAAVVPLTPAAASVLFRTPGPDSVWASDHFGVLARLALAAPRARAAGTAARAYPARWWTPVPEQGAPDWEILPQAAAPGEVVVSKRGELGVLSNFAPTPFTFRGRRYASLEGFWQMMLFPEGPDDPRARLPGVTWAHTRDQVAAMSAFEAKTAGTEAERALTAHGIDWVSFEGERFPYRPARPGRHHALIVAATEAKVAQNDPVRSALRATGDLTLVPDHVGEPDPPAAWRYCELLMAIRARMARAPR